MSPDPLYKLLTPPVLQKSNQMGKSGTSPMHLHSLFYQEPQIIWWDLEFAKDRQNWPAKFSDIQRVKFKNKLF